MTWCHTASSSEAQPQQLWAGRDNTFEPSSTQTHPQIWYDQLEHVYAASADQGMDSGTDTDTSSDRGSEDLPQPADTHRSEAEAAGHIYLQHRHSKRVWRSFTGKTSSEIQKSLQVSGKGKGYGGFFWTYDEASVFLKGQGKGHRQNSSGNLKNPKGPSG